MQTICSLQPPLLRSFSPSPTPVSELQLFHYLILQSYEITRRLLATRLANVHNCMLTLGRREITPPFLF